MGRQCHMNSVERRAQGGTSNDEPCSTHKIKKRNMVLDKKKKTRAAAPATHDNEHGGATSQQEVAGS